MTRHPSPTLQEALQARYADAPRVCADLTDHPVLSSMTQRGSCRAFLADRVPDAVTQTLCAVALAAPTKSDLQQRDIIVLRSPEQRARLAALVPEQAWVAQAPLIAVFCGNNRRQRLWHDWHGIAFANDHLDAPFNAAADAAIALGAFVTAAEAVGLGTCPISAVRNDAHAVSDLLDLPDHVFPFAGLAIGYPAQVAPIAQRLPLGVTVHTDRYREDTLRADVTQYDTTRAAAQPMSAQRFTANFGTADPYTWSLDKARQYSQPERASFGRYLRARGFVLD